MSNADEKSLNEHCSSSDTHRRTQSSSTLNRNYVRRPGNVRGSVSPRITSIAKTQSESLKRRQALAEKINRERLTEMKKRAKMKKIEAEFAQSEPKKSVKSPMSLKKPMEKPLKSMNSPVDNSKKDAAIKSALASVSTMETRDKKSKKRNFRTKRTFNAANIAIAFCSAAAIVAGIGYVASVNVPEVSVQVAAMQTGIDAAYPSYIPREYSLSSVTSEDGKVTMTFISKDASFTLTEERSSWNSSALESNFVKSAYDDNYDIISEQGLTIFTSSSESTWVNGGILYKISSTGKNLTKKQLKSIAASL